MIVYEGKLKGKKHQYERLDEAIRTGVFIRNACLRYWEDGHAKNRNDLSKYCTILGKSKEWTWAGKLNSQARQAMSERAWAAISRFFDNCKKQVKGKKGYPKYKKNRANHGSVEYKTSGWKLSETRDSITFTDGFQAGEFKLYGTRDLNYYQLEQIKRVRVVRRADGYYAQFCIDHDRTQKKIPTGNTVGLDVGLNHLYTDSRGVKVDNPRFLRKSEKQLKRLQKRVSKKFRKGKPQSNNYKKAKQKLAKKHLKVTRQRKDFAVKTALCVIQSNDLVAYVDAPAACRRLDLQVRNMVKNHHLAKSISDAAWSEFRRWLEYFGKVFGVATVAVKPHYTSQNCSNCGCIVKKSLSTRTHKCLCGFVLDRECDSFSLNLATGGRLASVE
ncbi:MAG: transposase [Coleofasciculus sp. G3-WIS-01]|uniref:RNA-guided endonuclease InsQ/TnpB family protein n=1 Tax=Coleofasciculus sp. G3-WIS-01 TaxID=3069528 RepID=UPI0032FC1756